MGDMTMIPWNQQSNAIEAFGFTNFKNCIFEELPNRVSWHGLRLGLEILTKLGRDFSSSSGKLHRAKKEARQISETFLS